VMKNGGTLGLGFRIEPKPASPSKLPSFAPEEAERLLAAAAARDAILKTLERTLGCRPFV